VLRDTTSRGLLWRSLCVFGASRIHRCRNATSSAVQESGATPSVTISRHLLTQSYQAQPSSLDRPELNLKIISILSPQTPPSSPTSSCFNKPSSLATGLHSSLFSKLLSLSLDLVLALLLIRGGRLFSGKHRVVEEGVR